MEEIEKFNYTNQNLYFENSLLLENVKEFSLNQSANKITIFINLDNKIAQTWEFLQ